MRLLLNCFAKSEYATFAWNGVNGLDAEKIASLRSQ